MKWPWRHGDEDGREVATDSRMQAERDLQETRAQTPRYKAIADSLREIREENHFAERIAASLRGD